MSISLEEQAADAARCLKAAREVLAQEGTVERAVGRIEDAQSAIYAVLGSQRGVNEWARLERVKRALVSIADREDRQRRGAMHVGDAAGGAA